MRLHNDPQVELNYDIGQYGADFVFNIHAAHTANQRVIAEALSLSQPVMEHTQADPGSGSRYMRLHANSGSLRLLYAATLEIAHHRANPETLQEVAVRDLPPEVMCYIYPSRYCQSDRLGNLAIREFGGLPRGYVRVEAIRRWVNSRIRFLSNSSDSNTSAVDTLISEVGVCRDFAHLMIALCRALSIPARFTTGTDYGADPVLGAPDFHAYVEAYVGNRWYIFDPSGTAIPMGLIRLGTGRDAADVAIATIFGQVQSRAPMIRTEALSDTSNSTVLPYHCRQALSTDEGPVGRPEP